MKTSLNEKISEISIPDSLDARIIMGFDTARLEKGIALNRLKKKLAASAASAAIIFLMLGFIGFDKVGAAMKEALKYVPGFNVLLKAEDSDILVLPKQIEAQTGEHYIRLKAAVQRNDILSLVIESNLGLYEDPTGDQMTGEEKFGRAFDKRLRDLNLALTDSNGTVFEKKDWSLGAGGESWLQNADFKVVEGTTDYNLTAGDVSLDFSLTVSEGVNSLLNLGPHATDKGITIVGLLSSYESEVHVDLVSSAKTGLIDSYAMGEESHYTLFGSPFPLESLHLIDGSGVRTYPEIPSSYGNLLSNFVFKTNPQSDYRLVLPYMEMSYPDEKSGRIRLQTPEDGETLPLDESVKIGDFTVDFLDITRDGDDVIIKINSEPLEDEILSGFTINGVGSYGISWENEPVIILSYEEVGRSFSMRLISPTTFLKGDWIIDLSQEK